MTDKPFKTIEEQIDLLSSRGLLINDRDKARDVLLTNNYYFITGYKNLLLKPNEKDAFKDNATFEELYDLYCLDKRIRMLTLDVLLSIEQKVKTILAYEICKRYGNECSCYKDKDVFEINNQNTNKVLSKIEGQITKSKTKNRSIKHYVENHNSDIPLWVAVNVLTFGVLEKMYASLKGSDKDYISKKLLSVDIPKYRAKNTEVFLELIVDSRNVCAHDEMFMNFVHGKVMIPITNYHSFFNVYKNDKGNIVGGRKDLFALIISIKHFIPKEQFNTYVFSLKKLLDNHMNAPRCYSKDDLYRYIHLPADFEKIASL